MLEECAAACRAKACATLRSSAAACSLWNTWSTTSTLRALRSRCWAKATRPSRYHGCWTTSTHTSDCLFTDRVQNLSSSSSRERKSEQVQGEGLEVFSIKNGYSGLFHSKLQQCLSSGDRTEQTWITAVWMLEGQSCERMACWTVERFLFDDSVNFPPLFFLPTGIFRVFFLSYCCFVSFSVFVFSKIWLDKTLWWL